jgi:endo-1,4-beta-xylanase
VHVPPPFSSSRFTLRPRRLASAALAAGVAAVAGWAAPLNVPLWDGIPPSFIKDAPPEGIDAAGTVDHVSVPAISVHLPSRERATGAALIVCPGGSYSRVGLFTTGMGTVDYFVPKGIAIVVLKYRTRPPSVNVMADSLADAQRAVRLVRLHATEWGIDPKRIGLVGSSAGSHLVLNLATHWDKGNPAAPSPIDRLSSRPDFIGLLCPWPNSQPVSDFPVTADTPPAFIASARDDQIAPTAFAEGIAAAYAQAGVKSHLWLIEKGGHTAFKTGNRGEGGQWPQRLTAWLENEAGLPLTSKGRQR